MALPAVAGGGHGAGFHLLLAQLANLSQESESFVLDFDSHGFGVQQHSADKKAIGPADGAFDFDKLLQQRPGFHGSTTLVRGSTSVLRRI